MKKRRTWFATISCGVGMIKWEKYENMTSEEATDYARSDCIDFSQEYGYEQDEDHFSELDSLGRNWDEETEEYEDVSELDYYIEEYDPEEHDGYLQ